MQSGGAGASSRMLILESVEGVCMAAADGAGGHLATASLSTLQGGVCHAVNGCVDTTQAFLSSLCLSQLKLFRDADV